MEWYLTLSKARRLGRQAMAASGIGTVVLRAFAGAGDAGAQPRGHSIYMTAVEFKGTTTSDKVAPPSIDPSRLSHGYTYKAPGQADQATAQRWEVASYQFAPSFVTAYQGDSIMLSVFIASGDHHDVQLTDPDGQVVIAKATWDRGREYTKFFQVEKVGDYHLECGLHKPSMTATIMVLPH
jgi:plastocyanin